MQLSLQSSKHKGVHQNKDGTKHQAAGLWATLMPAQVAAAVPRVKLASVAPRSQFHGLVL